MERNTLVAILLSAALLFTYQALFVAPKPLHTLNKSQLTQKNEVINEENIKESQPKKLNETTTSEVKKTDDYTIKTHKSIFSFSKVGGLLHNTKFLGSNPLPLTDVISLSGFGNVVFKGQQIDNKEVSFFYQDKDWKITKTYQIKDQNTLSVRMEIKNISEISILKNFVFKSFKIDDSNLLSQNNRENNLDEYSVYLHKGFLVRRDNATKFNDKNNLSKSAKIGWVGFRDHYDAVIIKPEFDTAACDIKSESDKKLSIYIKAPEKKLGPGESVVYNFSIYAGPQDRWLMKKYGSGFENIVIFSKYWIYEWPAQLIYHAIYIFHLIFKNWGIAIILIGITFYGLTYPLTMKSMLSMRKMQEIQPKIKALQERHKNDPQKAQAEMMEIYRREKINPMSGCLPFLIQMPFFYALLQIMWRAQYFQGQHFLWIKDLTQPDRLIILPFYLPFVGNEFNILPIITGGLFYLQQRISSKNVVVTDEQQAMQQKMMMYILPVMMTFMFYKFASAWALYFLVYYSLATTTQWRLSKRPKT
ncbi:MAG: YidC/Oxa1 family insertase periplasmic-domain containing protein [Candidatus Omnitrophica bacterium]|nr:YidC/Oxa1 family insertase periplasmic-domain containing protein [Candidatus Omnitrophota bacterium]